MTILGWLSRSKRDDLVVVVYTRNGCHLCDDAWHELERFQAKHQFHLSAKDIDADPALAGQFNTCVPVIEVNGHIRMRGRFNPVLFQRLLDAKVP